LIFVFLPAGYLILILILGTVLGVIGSFIAIGRFLKYEEKTFFHWQDA